MKAKKTTELIVMHIDEIPKQGKEVLKQYQTKGLVTRATNGDGLNRHTVLYEKDKFVIIVPNGEEEKALLYGNWDAALHATKQIIVGENGLQPNVIVSIEPYLH